MSMYRLIAGLVGFAFLTAAGMAVVGLGAEVRAESASVVAKTNPAEVLASDGLRARTLALRMPMAS